jgi:uncharacterized protein (TIGR02284 family)
MAASKTTTTLNELVAILDDGEAFYREAATRVSRSDVNALFLRMARNKAAIAADLRDAIAAAGGNPMSGGTLPGALLRGWGDLRARLSTDARHEYIERLEAFEDRILRAFREVVDGHADTAVRELAQRHIEEISRDHAEMRAMARSDGARG